MPSNKIWVAGVGFEVAAKVYRWDEGPKFDSHQNRCVNPHQPCPNKGVFPYSQKKPVFRNNRFAKRPALRSQGDNPSLAAAQSVVKQFVLHHDGVGSAESCFNVLHNERGLSCHFLLDNNGDIYQTLDMAYMGFHAAGFNANSIGIEMCNRGDAKRDPKYYSKKKVDREAVTCRIHGHTYLAFIYTEAQMTAMRALVKALTRALPNLPIDYPQESPGYQSWTEIANAKSYAGLLGHYHTTRRKWDPGPFDFKGFCESVRGQLSFMIAVRGDKPDIPDDTEQLRADANKLYAMNENKTEGGFFPIGPYGATRLWHGGVHIAAKRKQPVFAPFAGRVMAVRTAASSAVGSTNMVLMRHDLSVGKATIRFYSLYFHLEDEFGREEERDAPRWMQSEAWADNRKRGRVVLIDEPLEAGDVIGRVGLGGPSASRKAQVHVEILSADEIGNMIKPNTFTVIDGTASGRFVDQKTVLSGIDTSKDGELSRRELLDFFSSNSDRKIARYYATLHVSEWIGKPSWTEALSLAPEFKSMSKKDIGRLVDDQITPTLWWDDRVAKHAKLPRDGVVYHYNPITFVKFVNEELQKANVLADVGLGAFDKSQAKVRPKGVLDDIDDVSGESFVDESELKEIDLGHDLTLEDLANGFPE